MCRKLDQGLIIPEIRIVVDNEGVITGDDLLQHDFKAGVRRLLVCGDHLIEVVNAYHLGPEVSEKTMAFARFYQAWEFDGPTVLLYILGGLWDQGFRGGHAGSAGCCISMLLDNELLADVPTGARNDIVTLQDLLVPGHRPNCLIGGRNEKIASQARGMSPQQIHEGIFLALGVRRIDRLCDVFGCVAHVLHAIVTDRDDRDVHHAK